MSRIAWTREATAALYGTLPFMAFSSTVGGDNPGTITDAGVDRQFDSFDVICCNNGSAPYSGANRIRARAARTDTVIPCRVIEYNNDCRICKKASESGDLAAKESYHGAVLKDEIIYEAAAGGVTPTTGALRVQKAVRPPTGNYMNRLDLSAVRVKIVNFYKQIATVRDPATDGTSDPVQGADALMPDTMGPFPFEDKTLGVPNAKSQSSGTNSNPPWWLDASNNDIDTYLNENKTMLRDLQRGGVTAAGSEWAAGYLDYDDIAAGISGAPIIANGGVDGLKYKAASSAVVNSNPDDDETARNTRRLVIGNGVAPHEITGLMFELAGRGEYQAVGTAVGTANLWPTNAEIEAGADMLVDMEFYNKVAFWCTKLWVNQGVDEDARVAMCKRWFKLTLANFLLGANGRSVFTFRDDTVGTAPAGGTHRALEYPTGTVTGGGASTFGRRHQFASQYFGENDKWMKRIRGIGVGAAYTSEVDKQYTNPATGHYQRVFPAGAGSYFGGVVYVNNTATDWVVTPGAGKYREIEDADTSERNLDGDDTITVPARAAIILVRTDQPFGFTYQTETATSVTTTSAAFKASTTDTAGANHATVSIAGGPEQAMVNDGGSPEQYHFDATGLTPGTTYSATFRFYASAGGALRGTANSEAYVTTTAAGSAPTFPSGAAIFARATAGRITLRCPPASDVNGVVAYVWTRTPTAGGKTVTFTITSTGRPPAVFTDSTVRRGVQYDYTVKARNAAAMLSSALAKTVTAHASDAPGGWAG